MKKYNNMLFVKFLFCAFCFLSVSFSQNDEVQHSYAFPVPCYTNKGQDSIKFVNLPKDALVHIYTLNGENVLTIKEGSNGKMFQSEWSFTEYKPSSDVYIYVITKDNTSKAGKLIIIK
ncbi:MAG: T9SS type A sorting domain-containing protein [Endomicrobia bacterium]|nr:T9SS type A sorting domain-containing protein [Endomicrobiia bacterium]